MFLCTRLLHPAPEPLRSNRFQAIALQKATKYGRCRHCGLACTPGVVKSGGKVGELDGSCK